jgi:hypothetical protein
MTRHHTSTFMVGFDGDKGVGWQGTRHPESAIFYDLISIAVKKITVGA